RLAAEGRRSCGDGHAQRGRHSGACRRPRRKRSGLRRRTSPRTPRRRSRRATGDRCRRPGNGAQKVRAGVRRDGSKDRRGGRAAPEAGIAIKLANNFVLGCAIETMAEGFSLVRKYGVNPQVFYDVMTEGLFAAPAYKVYGKLMVDSSYDKPGFTTRLGLKDIKLALAAAELVSVPLPSGSVVRDRLVGAIPHRDGDQNWAGLGGEQGRACGIE